MKKREILVIKGGVVRKEVNFTWSSEVKCDMYKTVRSDRITYKFDVNLCLYQTHGILCDTIIFRCCFSSAIFNAFAKKYFHIQ